MKKSNNHLTTFAALCFVIISNAVIDAKRPITKIPVTIKKETPFNRTKLHFRNTGNNTGVPKVTNPVHLHQQVFGPLKFGSMHKDMIVMFDTGSPWLWIDTKDCESCDSYGMADGYDCSASTTCNITKETDDYKYGIGETKAHIAYDSVGFDSQLTVQNFQFGLGDWVADSSDLQGANGICGLSFGDETIIDALKKQKKIQERIFAMQFHGSFDDPASMYIGGIDPSTIDLTKSWYTIPMTSTFEWVGEFDGMAANGGANFKIPTLREALFDSGTSHIILDEFTHQHFVQGLSDDVSCFLNGGFDLVCAVENPKLREATVRYDNGVTDAILKHYPTLSFTVAKQTFTLEPQYYIAGCEKEGKETLCQLLIAQFNIGLAILGDPLFQKYTVVFDKESKKVLLFETKRKSS